MTFNGLRIDYKRPKRVHSPEVTRRAADQRAIREEAFSHCRREMAGASEPGLSERICIRLRSLPSVDSAKVYGVGQIRVWWRGDQEPEHVDLRPASPSSVSPGDHLVAGARRIQKILLGGGIV